jgi:hypothetical protein
LPLQRDNRKVRCIVIIPLHPEIGKVVEEAPEQSSALLSVGDRVQGSFLEGGWRSAARSSVLGPLGKYSVRAVHCRAGVVGLTLIVVGLAAAGCDSHIQREKAFQKSANEACAKFDAVTRSVVIEPYGTLSQELAGLRKDISARETEAANLRRLDPPHSDILPFRRFIIGLGRLNAVERSMLRELETRDSLRFPGPLFAQFTATAAAQRDLARRLGLVGCASSANV